MCIYVAPMRKTHDNITKSNPWNCRACSVWQPIENALKMTWTLIVNTDEKTNRYIDIYICIKKWWTYANIYVYTNKKSVEIIIVYYIYVSKHMYI